MYKPDAIVFDMDGVLRVGSQAIPNASEIIKLMEINKIPGMVSTNECRYTEAELREDLVDIGINIPNNWCIYTAGMAVRDFLKKRIEKNVNKTYFIGIIGERGLFETINTLTEFKNCVIVDKPPNKKLNKNDELILIVGTVNKIKITNLEKGLDWINNNAKVITTCCDTTDPSSKGDFNLGMPSHILHLLKYNTRAIRQYSLGKPHPIFKTKILQELKGIPIEKIMFVGDTIYTDIRLANESNMISCLVLTGNSKIDTLNNFVIEPDLVVDSIWDLRKYID